MALLRALSCLALAFSSTLATAFARPVFGEHVPDVDKMDATWREFRRAFPYPYQCVALARLEDGSQVLVLSEPPPQVTIERLQTLLPKLVTREAPLGHDGFMRDVVAHVRLDEAALSDLVAEIHGVYFDTSYKASVVELPSRGIFASREGDLDLSIGPANLHEWVSGDSALSFVPIDSGGARRFAALDATYSTTLTSEPAGVVGWWIPKGTPLHECRVAARQFVVDGDLILGAVQNSRGVLVLARERQASVEALPPLRIETILLLASVEENELFQTINPQPLSGPVGDAESWQVNFLSPQLYDTEYGALLSIADVLLKSWSLHGLNTVRGFRDYPVPSRYPFEDPPFGRDLFTSLGFSELVFNYNAHTGASELDVGDSERVVGLQRTGVLPISYFPDGGKADDAKVLLAEDCAYDWFAAQNDPHLIRVAQYSALYQVFGAFDVHSKHAEPDSHATPESVRLQCTKDMLVALRQRGAAGRDAVMQAFGAELDTFSRELKSALENGDVEADDVASFESERKRLSVRARTWLTQLTKFDDAQIEQLAARIDDGASSSDRRDVARKLAPSIAVQDKFSDRLVAATLAHPSLRWIHTPILIVDRNTGGISGTIGGHTLPQGVVRTFTDAKVPVGTIRASFRNGERVNLVHPSSAGSLTIRTRGLPPTFGPSTLQPVRAALKLPEVARPPLAVASQRIGWGRAALHADDARVIAAVRSRRPSAVVVVQREGTYVVQVGDRTFTAPTQRQAVDAVVDTTRMREIDIELAGFSQGEARAFKASFGLRTKAIDRTFALQHGDEFLHTLPQTHDIDGATVSTFRLVEGNTKLEAVVAVPGRASGIGAKLSVEVQAERGLDVLLDARDRFLDVIKNLLRGKDTPRDLHDAFRSKLRSAFPGLDVESLKLRTGIELGTRGVYISNVPERTSGTAATS